mgnify:CR=1 FL=1
MNNKIYRLQNRLKNKEIEVAKLTEKIVDNELKLIESFRCSLFTVLITLVVFLSYYSNNYIFQGIALILTIMYAIMMNRGIVKGFAGKFIKR